MCPLLNCFTIFIAATYQHRIRICHFRNIFFVASLLLFCIQIASVTRLNDEIKHKINGIDSRIHRIEVTGYRDHLRNFCIQ